MAEKKKKIQKRVLVTVSPSMYELIETLGREANVATSQLIGEMIEEARPAFEAILQSVREAKEQQASAFDTLHRLLITTQEDLSRKQLDLLDSKTALIRRRKDRV